MEFSKACTALITNANAPELIQKVLGQRDTILRMESIEGERNRTHFLFYSGFHFIGDFICRNQIGYVRAGDAFRYNHLEALVFPLLNQTELCSAWVE